MLKIVLHKDPNAESPLPEFLTLPASRWDIIDACARLRIDNPNRAFIEFGGVEEMPSLNRALKQIGPSPHYFEELQFLARRLTLISSGQRFIMGGLILMESPESLAELINLTYNLENVLVAGDIHNDHELGKFLVDNDFWEFPEKVIPYLDFEKIGYDQRGSTNSIIYRGVYYEDHREPEDIRQMYDGVSLPEQLEEPAVFHVSIANARNPPGDGPVAELDLPAAEEELSDALEKIGAYGCLDAVVTECISHISDFDGIADSDAPLSELLALADSISRMSDADYIKYKAVLEYEGLPPARSSGDKSLLRRINELSGQLGKYSFSPEITSEDIGSYGYVRQAESEPYMQLGGM